MNQHEDFQDVNSLPKRYRALLRARYYDQEGKEALLQKEVHLYAKNDIEAEIQFGVYPKIESSQEEWHVSSIECLE